MAIQIPNPGTGNGATGDNEFVLWSKVKENFSDQTNAASLLVGHGAGRLPKSEQVSQAYHKGENRGSEIGAIVGQPTFSSLAAGKHFVLQASNAIDAPKGIAGYAHVIVDSSHASNTYGRQWAFGHAGIEKTFIRFFNDGGFGNWQEFYTSSNTTKDAGTGFLKVSSPVLHVYNDKIDRIHEAEQLDIVVDKKGVGHYEIHGTTGLRQDDGWNMSPPRDIHGNVRCMIEVTEKGGVITVKTYKRKFDLELAAIVHDYDNPLDIPAGACVELRFNDLPYEIEDDIQTEV